MSWHGSFRSLGNSSYAPEDKFPTADAAFAAPHIVDGRTLDRAEYFIYVTE